MLRALTLSTLAALAAWSYDLPSSPTPRAPITLVLEYETTPAVESLAEMRREMDSILKGTGIRVDWKLRSEMKLGEDVADLALVRLRGNCRMEAMPVVFDERGPLAFAHTSDGEILPFTDVVCDRVRVLTKSAMTGADVSRANLLLGRALARVVAHELYHIVTGSQHHDDEGVTRHALSGKQLISGKLTFSRKTTALFTQQPRP